MNKGYLVFTFLLLCLFGVSTFAIAVDDLPQSMRVVTANAKPLQNIAYAESALRSAGYLFTIHNLDSVAEFEQVFSENLPADKKKAKAMLEQRINEIGRSRFNTQLLAAYRGIVMALRYKLDRYPAIVFDDSQVVYGVTDLQLALNLYRQWRAKQEMDVDG